MRYFLGALMSLAGVAMVIKTEWLIKNLGKNAWAEEKFGSSGGTRTMYKLIGLIAIFLGFLTLTNMIGGFLRGTVGRLFNLG